MAREIRLQGTKKEKWEYFFDYYKGHVIGGIIAICILISVIVDIVSEKEALLTGVMMNNQISSEEVITKFEEDFLLFVNKNPSQYEISLMTELNYINEADSFYEENMVTMQAISAQVTGKLLDVVCGDLRTMLLFAYGEHFTDLSLILTKEQMIELKPYLLYMDRAVLDKAKNDANSSESEKEFIIPDCRRPEEMIDPVPIFIDLYGCEKLTGIYQNEKNAAVLAVAANAPHVDMIRAWVDYLGR